MAAMSPVGAQVVAAYQALRSTGGLSKVTLHRYQCRAKGCTLAVVFRLPAGVVAYTPAYRLSPGMTAAQTSADGRESNSVDGVNHWPAHGWDLADLAAWQGRALVSIQCAHYRGTLDPRAMLVAVDGVKPGRPTRPTVL